MTCGRSVHTTECLAVKQREVAKCVLVCIICLCGVCVCESEHRSANKEKMKGEGK